MLWILVIQLQPRMTVHRNAYIISTPYHHFLVSYRNGRPCPYCGCGLLSLILTEAELLGILHLSSFQFKLEDCLWLSVWHHQHSFQSKCCIQQCASMSAFTAKVTATLLMNNKKWKLTISIKAAICQRLCKRENKPASTLISRHTAQQKLNKTFIPLEA